MKINFWVSIIAVVSFALGTIPTFHGILFWFIGAICVAILYWLNKK